MRRQQAGVFRVPIYLKQTIKDYTDGNDFVKRLSINETFLPRLVESGDILRIGRMVIGDWVRSLNKGRPEAQRLTEQQVLSMLREENEVISKNLLEIASKDPKTVTRVVYGDNADIFKVVQRDIFNLEQDTPEWERISAKDLIIIKGLTGTTVNIRQQKDVYEIKQAYGEALFEIGTSFQPTKQEADLGQIVERNPKRQIDNLQGYKNYSLIQQAGITWGKRLEEHDITTQRANTKTDADQFKALIVPTGLDFSFGRLKKYQGEMDEEMDQIAKAVIRAVAQSGLVQNYQDWLIQITQAMAEGVYKVLQRGHQANQESKFEEMIVGNTDILLGRDDINTEPKAMYDPHLKRIKEKFRILETLNKPNLENREINTAIRASRLQQNQTLNQFITRLLGTRPGRQMTKEVFKNQYTDVVTRFKAFEEAQPRKRPVEEYELLQALYQRVPILKAQDDKNDTIITAALSINNEHPDMVGFTKDAGQMMVLKQISPLFLIKTVKAVGAILNYMIKIHREYPVILGQLFGYTTKIIQSSETTTARLRDYVQQAESFCVQVQMLIKLCEFTRLKMHQEAGRNEYEERFMTHARTIQKQKEEAAYIIQRNQADVKAPHIIRDERIRAVEPRLAESFKDYAKKVMPNTFNQALVQLTTFQTEKQNKDIRRQFRTWSDPNAVVQTVRMAKQHFRMVCDNSMNSLYQITLREREVGGALDGKATPAFKIEELLRNINALKQLEVAISHVLKASRFQDLDTDLFNLNHNEQVVAEDAFNDIYAKELKKEYFKWSEKLDKFILKRDTRAVFIKEVNTRRGQRRAYHVAYKTIKGSESIGLQEENWFDEYANNPENTEVLIYGLFAGLKLVFNKMRLEEQRKLKSAHEHVTQLDSAFNQMQLMNIAQLIKEAAEGFKKNVKMKNKKDMEEAVRTIQNKRRNKQWFEFNVYTEMLYSKPFIDAQTNDKLRPMSGIQVEALFAEKWFEFIASQEVTNRRYRKFLGKQTLDSWIQEWMIPLEEGKSLKQQLINLAEKIKEQVLEEADNDDFIYDSGALDNMAEEDEEDPDNQNIRDRAAPKKFIADEFRKYMLSIVRKHDIFTAHNLLLQGQLMRAEEEIYEKVRLSKRNYDDLTDMLRDKFEMNQNDRSYSFRLAQYIRETLGEYIPIQADTFDMANQMYELFKDRVDFRFQTLTQIHAVNVVITFPQERDEFKTALQTTQAEMLDELILDAYSDQEQEEEQKGQRPQLTPPKQIQNEEEEIIYPEDIQEDIQEKEQIQNEEEEIVYPEDIVQEIIQEKKQPEKKGLNVKRKKKKLKQEDLEEQKQFEPVKKKKAKRVHQEPPVDLEKLAEAKREALKILDRQRALGIIQPHEHGPFTDLVLTAPNEQIVSDVMAMVEGVQPIDEETRKQMQDWGQNFQNNFMVLEYQERQEDGLFKAYRLKKQEAQPELSCMQLIVQFVFYLAVQNSFEYNRNTDIYATQLYEQIYVDQDAEVVNELFRNGLFFEIMDRLFRCGWEIDLYTGKLPQIQIFSYQNPQLKTKRYLHKNIAPDQRVFPVYIMLHGYHAFVANRVKVECSQRKSFAIRTPKKARLVKQEQKIKEAKKKRARSIEEQRGIQQEIIQAQDEMIDNVFKFPKDVKGVQANRGELFYDFETTSKKGEKLKPFAVCLVGQVDGIGPINEQFVSDIEEIQPGEITITKSCTSKMVEALHKISKQFCQKAQKLKKDDFIQVVGYNNSKFDNFFLIQELALVYGPNAFTIIGSINDSKMIFFERFVFTDYYLVTGNSLKNTGPAFGVEAALLKDNFNILDYPELKDLAAVQDQVLKYCTQDCLALKAIVEKSIQYFNTVAVSLASSLLQEVYNEKNRDLWIKQENLDGIIKRLEAIKKGERGSIFLEKQIPKTISSLAVYFVKFFQFIFPATYNGVADAEIEHVLRCSYRGGLCEVFNYQRVKNVAVLDINSHYPNVMANNYLPAFYMGCIQLMGDDQTDLLKLKLVVAKTNLHKVEAFEFVRDRSFVPNIPQYTEKSKKVIYATRGENLKDVYMWGCELINNINRNRFVMLRISKVYRFTPYHKRKEVIETLNMPLINDLKMMPGPQHPFGLIAKHLYQIRMSSECEITKHVTKIIINSLYGYLGKNQHPKVQYFTIPEWNLFTGYESSHKQQDFPSFASFIRTFIRDNYQHTIDMEQAQNLKPCLIQGNQYLKTKVDPQFKKNQPGNLVYVASFITAQARSELAEHIQTAGGAECVYYCDTDSVFIDSAKVKDFEKAGKLIPKKLGALKNEIGAGGVDDKLEWLKVWAKKCYNSSSKDKCAFKGLPKMESQMKQVVNKIYRAEDQITIIKKCYSQNVFRELELIQTLSQEQLKAEPLQSLQKTVLLKKDGEMVRYEFRLETQLRPSRFIERNGQTRAFIDLQEAENYLQLQQKYQRIGDQYVFYIE